MKEVRLDKFLADMQVGTRSKVKKFIKKGIVRVDGLAAMSPDMKIQPDRQKVTYQGRILQFEEFVYYMLFKPMGCVTAREDKDHPTVMEYIKDGRKNLSPVGRLDIDTEGLLLITDDGALSHALLSPSRHVDKTYEARIQGKVTEEDVCRFAEGLEIGDDKPAKPGKLAILDSAAISHIRLTITEGRFHQVKRMFEAVGKEVIHLKRIQMGTLCLDENLKPGECRKLTAEEVEALKTGRERKC